MEKNCNSEYPVLSRWLMMNVNTLEVQAKLSNQDNLFNYCSLFFWQDSYFEPLHLLVVKALSCYWIQQHVEKFCNGQA